MKLFSSSLECDGQRHHVLYVWYDCSKEGNQLHYQRHYPASHSVKQQILKERKRNLAKFLNLSISTNITYLDSRGQVEVVFVFPACVHHAVQHAEDHVAEEAQVLWCGRRWRFKPKLTLINLLKLLFFRTRHHHKIIFSSYLLLAKRHRDIFDKTNLLNL